MITLTIKGISRKVHREWKVRAANHKRSLNSEVILMLESIVRSVPAETEGAIPRARQFRDSLKFRVTAGDLKRFKEQGRA
jgi:plasmid stability protein